MASGELSLNVNGEGIPLDYFVQGFIDRVITGILETLRGTGPINNLSLAINGEEVRVNLNNDPVAINRFVNKIIRNTVIGMVSSLKGVGQIDNLEIRITK